jgi:DNA-binding transcriptional MerR regulator
VLRFWESRFTQIRPLKRGGGRRYYRPDDVDLLRGVRHLLYGEGYTIRGVQRILREEGLSFVQSVWRTEVPAADFADEDEAAREELKGQDDAEDAGEFEDEAEQEADGDEEAEGEALSRPREPSFFEGPPTTAARADGRREPSLIPQSSLAPPAAAPARLSVDSQSRQKLEAALGELLACRGLIHAVLTDAPERRDEPG